MKLRYSITPALQETATFATPICTKAQVASVMYHCTETS